MHVARYWLMVGLLQAGWLCAAEQAGVQAVGSRPAGAAEFPARTFGAVGDGVTLDTSALQRAIDGAGEHGGTVVLSAGRYLSGTLRLRSHVTLRLEQGATLLGSTKLADFPTTVPALRSWTDNYIIQSLLYAEDVEDVAIVGQGTIDGQGGAFKGRPYKERPYIIRMMKCRNVVIEGITLRDSPMWVQHYLACDGVAIRGIQVLSRCNDNNDGVDIDGCRNVRISDCSISSGDDAIVLKSTSQHLCENVTITNCTLSTRCNALKLGTETSGGFRQIAMSNCAIYDTQLSGISLMIVDGGQLDGVVISNITMRDTRVPLYIRLADRARTPAENMPRPKIGSVRNISISHIIATGADRLGSSITGLPEHPVENVTLHDIRFEYGGGGLVEHSHRRIPELPDVYPECVLYGTLPSYGLYCRHVRGLQIDGADFRTDTPDGRPAIVADDVKDLDVDNLHGSCSPDTPAFIMLHDVIGARLRGCAAPQGKMFLSVTGRSERISLLGNDLSGSARPYLLGDGVQPGVLFAAANRVSVEKGN